MSLNKSKGNMYPWVTHTHSHIGGECPHKCVYCYVDNPRFGRPKRYQGEIRLLEEELAVDYKKNRTIFVEHCNDLFANDVPRGMILAVLEHCKKHPMNDFVFQTKNPARMVAFIDQMPPRTILGMTAETNRDMDTSKAPPPRERLEAFQKINTLSFITIEPILAFDLEEFSDLIIKAKPNFVNIGADSKNHGLQEPTFDEIMELVELLQSSGIEIREKHNLERFRPT